MIKFNANPQEMAVIKAIAERASKLGIQRNQMATRMDLDAVHSNGCPMDFEKLLAADDFNFTHDISGIRNCLDRDDNSKTAGKLLNHFLPRCALRD